MYYFGNLCVIIIPASLDLHLLGRTTLKILFSIFASACPLFNINMGHAERIRSSAGGLPKGGAESFNGGGASGDF